MHIALALVAVALAGSALAVDVTTCGQSIPDGDTGVLPADSRRELRHRRRRCLRHRQSPGGAILTDVNLTNNSEDGISSWQGAIRASGGTAAGNGESGIYANEKAVVLRNVIVSNNGDTRIDGHPARGAGLTIQVSTRRPRVRNITWDRSRNIGPGPGQTWGGCALD